ncbi:MAG: DNA repair protein RadA [Planctomycetes bacterium]|nr:DNA repair protein RadA [Planctomycetota bacterium]
MTKANTIYVCQQCDWKSSRWVGRCGNCGQWDSMVEETFTPSKHETRNTKLETPQPISKIQMAAVPNIKTSVEEFDRILGGGVIAGSVVLIGGPPGIGKSTLLLQICNQLGLQGHTSLYITGEESLTQVKLHAERLAVKSDNVLVVSETNVDAILEYIKNTKPTIAVIDSIQTMYNPVLESVPGTVSQVRECANQLVQVAKNTGTTVFLIGHVTKQGVIAGPMVLEHMADTVLYFEGDNFQFFRILRAVKNRFGPTNEIGIFEMCNDGLKPVSNPSEIFLSHSRGTLQRASTGSGVISCIEGSRAFLVELQALVTRTSFGVAERKVNGVDYNRVSMLVAVLEKRAGLQLGGQDIFVNVVGGVKVDEPASDLGIAMTMASSFLEKPIPSDTVIIGEIGLGGEVRGVSQIETRLKEAQKLGFKRAILPDTDKQVCPCHPALELIKITHISEALESLK